MTPKEASHLKVGEKVEWGGKEIGEVIEASYSAVRVRWNDGRVTLYTFHDVEPLSDLEVTP